MSWMITAVVVVSGLVTADTQKKQGKAQKYELDRQAEVEELASQGRELQRAQRLNKVLAANVVGQVTSGMAGEGTSASISLSNAKQASISEGMESLSDRLRQSQLKRQGKAAASAGKTQAGTTLLDTGVKAMSLS